MSSRRSTTTPSLRRRVLPIVGLLALILVPAGCGGSGGSSTETEILSDELRDHVAWLASDAQQGRRSGTPSALRVANYLASEFERYGLEGIGDDGGYLQAFDFVADVALGRENKLSIEDAAGRQRVDTDWRPMAFSDNGSGSFEVVFAGYGISSEADAYDDYAGLDVTGKAVLVLPYGPQMEGGGMHFPAHHALRRKAAVARDRGASAILIAPHPALDPENFLEPLRYDSSPSTAGILAATVTVELAELLLGEAGTLSDILTRIDSSVAPESMTLDCRIDLTVDLLPVRREGYNVVGALTGAGPDAPWIVIGGHYDHLGRGGAGSLEPGGRKVHNGADDNASGTAGVLELAQAFAAEPPTSRNILFIAFDAEELGLLGSMFFVSNLPGEIGVIETMMNMDMIGRLTEDKLTVYGTGTSPVWDPLLDELNAREGFGFEMTRVPDGFGASDHSSFYSKEIPVLAWFTGTHGDYHRPSDDTELLNYTGQERIVRLIRDTVMALDSRGEPVVFQPSAQPEQSGGRMGFGVYTGVVPDFGYQGDGFAISGVNDGSPAAMAGLEGGDVILRWGERTIRNIYDYTYALQDGSPGQRVELEVRRGDSVFTVQVILGNSRTRER